MLKVLNTWINRYLGEEESVLLAVLLIFSLIILITLGQIIAPFIAALVFAFLLQGGVNRLMVLGVPRMVAVSSIFLVFISILTAILIVLLPLIGRQAINLVEKVPSMLDHSQGLLFLLSEKFPKIFSENQTSQLLTEASRELGGIAQNLVSFSFDTFPSLLALVLYVILVPLLVFFMLKDKEKLLNFLSGLFPHKRPMMRKIWKEMNSQMANYVRGKAIEIVIVGSVSYAIFLFFGLNYAALLALLVGLSVIIPYIGALLVSIPVVIVAYFQCKQQFFHRDP